MNFNEYVDEEKEAISEGKFKLSDLEKIGWNFIRHTIHDRLQSEKKVSGEIGFKSF